MTYARDFLARGGMGFVKELLWTGSGNVYNGGAIKYDLDWVAVNWQSNGCDLWEEVQSTSFFWGAYTMRRAMVEGAAFARQMNDTATAATYERAAAAINSTLAGHIQDGYVIEAQNRPKDGATICAFNNGYLEDGVFSPARCDAGSAPGVCCGLGRG
jgi:glucoamylase